MSYYVDATGEFSGNKTKKNGEKGFDVKYRLVSQEYVDMGKAWGIAWNQIRMKYPTFEGCKLRVVSIEGKPETYGQLFEISAHYSNETDEKETNYATITFSTRGGREKKIHSFSTTAYPAPGQAPAPNFNHGIGFNNGVFQGVDITVPKFGFSIDVELPGYIFPNAMFSFFHNITGSVNAEDFWIFPRGAVLFTGLTGNSIRKRNEDVYSLWYKLSFEFEASPELVSATVSPFTNVNKEGMEYFWTFHADTKDTQSGITVPQPVSAYVEKVYSYADFSWFETLTW